MSAPWHGCSVCEVRSEDRICEDCGRRATVTDCGHSAQPVEIARRWQDGATVCEDCDAARRAVRP